MRIASKFETEEISGGKECIMDSSSMGGCRREGGRTKVMRDMIGERKRKNSKSDGERVMQTAAISQAPVRGIKDSSIHGIHHNFTGIGYA